MIYEILILESIKKNNNDYEIKICIHGLNSYNLINAFDFVPIHAFKFSFSSLWSIYYICQCPIYWYESQWATEILSYTYIGLKLSWHLPWNVQYIPAIIRGWIILFTWLILRWYASFLLSNLSWSFG